MYRPRYGFQSLFEQRIRPALLGISILPTSTMVIPTLRLIGRKKVVFQSFNRHQKINFQCRRDKKNSFSFH